jgi:hypothetical protein
MMTSNTAASAAASVQGTPSITARSSSAARIAPASAALGATTSRQVRPRYLRSIVTAGAPGSVPGVELLEWKRTAPPPSVETSLTAGQQQRRSQAVR